MILPCDIYDTPREICSNTILGTKDIVDLYWYSKFSFSEEFGSSRKRVS
jgi:hypothetical protein